jgi:hypothetical protein
MEVRVAWKIIDVKQVGFLKNIEYTGSMIIPDQEQSLLAD